LDKCSLGKDTEEHQSWAKKLPKQEATDLAVELDGVERGGMKMVAVTTASGDWG